MILTLYCQYVYTLSIMDSASSHDSQGAPPKSLEELFTEINSLAICLKKSSAALHHQDNLPPGGRTVLTIVNQSGELTVPQIARSHSSSRQNIQVLVNRLARMGLVVATSNPAH